MTESVNIGDGDVPITIAGKEYKLVPRFEACEALCKSGEALTTLISRCAALDPAAIHRVVAAGLGRDPPDLRKKLFDTGLRHLSGPCVVFLVNLSNGGHPVPKEETAGPLEDQGAS